MEEILKRILQVTPICAKNNVEFNGSNDKTGSSNAAAFLDMVEIISNHNTAVNKLSSNYNSGSINYLSNKVQN
jgi:hypothetical protein